MARIGLVKSGRFLLRIGSDFTFSSLGAILKRFSGQPIKVSRVPESLRRHRAQLLTKGEVESYFFVCIHSLYHYPVRYILRIGTLETALRRCSLALQSNNSLDPIWLFFYGTLCLICPIGTDQVM